ncbi:VOC family protein [Kitasatospora sp. NBC_00240]|uniref:VOC family protein n=1 Tax=Kitasatospora sp. NBC_00240 TaxID=2903567 RepID=UPI00225BD0B9|nr:VOC family protein [Kitasatospora sp. NBC_00240]MCX5207862.1 VOC family protein [Kitasatospora sp. NBC_00240]
MTEQQRAPEVWRRENDSSQLTAPRVLVRVFLGPGALEPGIGFYERLQGVTADARFAFGALRLATVGAFLLIEGPEAELAPFRSTTGTLLVDDVRPYHDRLVAAGAEIVFPFQEVPTGAGFNARHPDGTVVEYVHHRPTAEGR